MNRSDILFVEQFAKRLLASSSPDEISYEDYLEYVRISAEVMNYLAAENLRLNAMFQQLMELNNDDR